ncbi:unnamed protein product [Rotaria magnacalcarata]
MGCSLCCGKKEVSNAERNRLFALDRFIDVDIYSRKTSLLNASDLMKPLVSLELALDSIIPKIDSHYIEKAKSSCHFPSEHGLTHDESAAIYFYTLRLDEYCVYDRLNQSLQSENQSQITPWLMYLTLLKSALDKLPNVTKTIWRGMHGNIRILKEMNPDIMWCTMSSASTTYEAIQNYLGPNATLLRIDSITGKNVTGYTTSVFDEVLFWPGTKLHMDGAPIMMADGSYVVCLVEMTNRHNSLPYIEKPFERNSTKASIKKHSPIQSTLHCSSVLSTYSLLPIRFSGKRLPTISNEKHFFCPFPGHCYSSVLQFSIT